MAQGNNQKRAMEAFKVVLRSVVIPHQHGATLVEIHKDYMDIEGRPLPFRELGFTSAQALMAAVPDTVRKTVNKFGETVYLAIHGESTQHIQEMVMNQKIICKKKKNRGGRGGGKIRVLPQVAPYRPMPIPPTNNPYHWPTISNNFDNNKNSNNNNNIPTNIPSNNVKQNEPGPATYARATEPFLSNYDIQNIRQLLLQYGPDGIKLPLFQILYKDKFGEELDPKVRGFTDLQHILSSIKDVCKVEIHSSFKFYVVKLLNYNKENISKVSETSKHNIPENTPEKMTNGNEANPQPAKVNSSPNKPPHPRIMPPSNNHVEASDSTTSKSQQPSIKKEANKRFPFVPLNSNKEDPLHSIRTSVSSSNSDKQNSPDQENAEDSELAELENFPNGVINIFKQILSSHPDGISASRFSDEYERISGVPPDPHNWSYFSLIEVFHALPSIFFVDPPGARRGQESDEEDECDSIIYSPETVPQSVRTRVERYQNRNNPSNTVTGEIDWATKVRIMSMLLKVTNCLPLKNFSTDFYLNYKETIAPERYGFNSFEEMFTKLSEELPIALVESYAGKEYDVFLRENYYNDWVDLCFKQNHYESIRRIATQKGVLLPGDSIIEVAVDERYVDKDEWIQIILVSVVNPNCFFVTLKGPSHSQQLDDLMKKLSDFYSGISPDDQNYTVPECYLHKDFYCCAIFDADQNWHRVKIVKVEANRKKVKVFFIDYGGEAIVDSSQLRLLKKDWGYFPAQAIRVSLKGIRPKGDRWHQNAKHVVLEYLNRGMAKNQHVLGRLYSRKSPHLKEFIKYEVEICDETEYGYEFLHKTLIEKGYAIEDDGKPKPPKSSPSVNTNNKDTGNGEVIRPSIVKHVRIPTKNAGRLKILKNLATMLQSQANSNGGTSPSENSDDLDDKTKQTDGSNLNGDDSSREATSSSNKGIIFPYHSKKDISFLKKLSQIEI